MFRQAYTNIYFLTYFFSVIIIFLLYIHILELPSVNIPYKKSKFPKSRDVINHVSSLEPLSNLQLIHLGIDKKYLIIIAHNKMTLYSLWIIDPRKFFSQENSHGNSLLVCFLP